MYVAACWPQVPAQRVPLLWPGQHSLQSGYDLQRSCNVCADCPVDRNGATAFACPPARGTCMFLGVVAHGDLCPLHQLDSDCPHLLLMLPHPLCRFDISLTLLEAPAVVNYLVGLVGGQAPLSSHSFNVPGRWDGVNPMGANPPGNSGEGACWACAGRKRRV